MKRHIDKDVARQLVEHVCRDTGEVRKVEVALTISPTETEKIEAAKRRSAARQMKAKAGSPFGEWGTFSSGIDGAAFAVMCDGDLSASDKNVFCAYAFIAKIGNIVDVEQKVIAEKMGMSKATVSRSLANLIGKGYIVKDKGVVKVSNSIVYRGSWKLYEKDVA